ncbi:MAG TPA: alkaline phosphatase family protein [Cyclobacteriaceae bacterium]|nr:alkaline phosphatase family protein [Cyclobacteriaceae bacterium]
MDIVRSFKYLLVLASGVFVREAAAQQKPRLILQVTVDQLRGDMPRKYMDRYGEGGFKYLFENGIHYINAHYAHSNTETGVGHTSLATGAYPSVSGVVGNEWFDVKKGIQVYCVDDDRYPVLPFADSSVTVIRPQGEAGTGQSGKSPANILCSTFSDELTLFSAGKSKTFGVSFKDRGAITLAGHTGKAFWFNSQSGDFVTSSYYYPEYPEWVRVWNRKRIADNYLGKKWELMHDQSGYIYGDRDDQPFEVNRTGYGRTFPHAYGNVKGASFYSMVTTSPAGDEILLDFTKALIENENVGDDTVTDFLAVSFSCTDYIGHTFSPSSLEAEDNILRLDRTLAGLFRFIDREIGLGNTLIVLSSDHGAGEAPALAAGFGFPAGHVIAEDLMNRVYENLVEHFGIGKELVRKFQPPHLYLDHDLIGKKKIPIQELNDFLIGQLTDQEGIEMAFAVNSADITGNANNRISNLVLNNYYPDRSGDIYIVPSPYWTMVWDRKSISYMASGHGSPWTYDTHVPVIFAGWGIQGKQISREIHVVDIAPTLSAISGSKYPSGNCGEVLQEVVCGIIK